MPNPLRLVDGHWQEIPNAMLDLINDHKNLCIGCQHSYSWQWKSCTILTRLLAELEMEQN